ncbi:DUF349 domain-containing protein [Halomonas sp. PAMB 3232]|uniref:DUF349 domain-containing protein n=1 Tax=Halomonas sp. PAMB 3232 TaxID=3075221 RepID=UPI00289B9DA8|nr:DUF349 domain-containing protein [Halomonas sp. PAMB 3232]WNL39381.1 DUF349 domain-containing protein [Halomonas sp. PAMB 3232]
MHGLLRRLFAPRWQHPNAEIRRQALETLDPQQPDQRDALKTLVDDPDPTVELAALLALGDLDTLTSRLPERQHVPGWREAVIERLTGREGQTDLYTRSRLVDSLSNTALLNEIALRGDNLDLRLTALERLVDDEDLIYQACNNGVASVRKRAAERLDSEASLKTLLKQARRDRNVMRLAREKLSRLRHDNEWFDQQMTRREELLEKLEQHARAPWEPLYGGRLRHLEREWRKLDHPPGPREEERFHQALLGARKTLNDHETQEQARQERQVHREEIETTRDQLLAGLEETLNGLVHAEAVTLQDIDSLRAQRQLLGQRWQSLSDLHAPPETTQARYTQALAAYERVTEAWQRWQTHQADVERGLADHDPATLEDRVKRVAWPKDLSKPALLQRAQALLALEQPAGEQTQKAPSLEALTAELDSFEHMLERGAFKSASRLHQRLKPSIDALNSVQANPLKARLKQLGAQLAELRDWRGFVAGPKREQLASSIETLAEAPAMADAALDRRHRQLVKEWKELGDAAASRALSTRFRAASERIHERLAPWRETLEQTRQANLRHREALCEQLETLCEQPADNADPDVLREIRDRARHQWREYTPIPREASETVGRRFGKVRHRLQALIDQRAEQIAAQKRALIDEVNALLHATERPIHERTTRTKALQQQWRTLGRAPKGEEQTLWKHFRGACDQLFAQRDAHKSEQSARSQQKLDAMQALIDEMDAWQPENAREAQALEAFIQRAQQLEPLPRNRRSEGMQRRLSGILRARRERLSRLEVADTVAQWHALMPLTQAHLSADQRAFEAQQNDAVEAAQVLATPPTGAFLDAHQRRNAARCAAISAPEQSRRTVEEGVARLRVHLSLLALGSVKPEDEPLRLAIQVERLNDGLGGERSQAEETRSVLAALMALGPVPGDVWDREVGELDALLSRLARPPHA